MPCSAEIEPPAAVTRSSTRRVIGGLALVPVGRRAAPRAHVEMDVAVAEMTEPARDRARERAFDIGAELRSMNARHVRDGTEISCASVWPFGPLGLGNAVADAPEGLGLRFVRGERRVRDEPLGQARPRAAARPPRDIGVSARPWSPRPALATDAAWQAAHVSGDVLQDQLERILGDELEALDGGSARLEEAKQRQRRGGSQRPAQATARAAIAGTSRRATAVITPSVPSHRSAAGRCCSRDCPS